MATGIDTFPQEILHKVLCDVKSISKADLRSCLAVSRMWHQIANPIFYSSVVLENNNVTTFIQTCNTRHYSLIHSLTLRIDAAKRYVSSVSPQTDNENWHDAHSAAVAMSQDIQKLKHILPLMNTLTIFSLYVDPHGEPFPTDSTIITKRCVMQLLAALPLSCVDLEIDTKGLDAYERDDRWDDGHLCDAVRGVLPRMRHVRLRLHAACSALVGEGPVLNCTTPDSSELYRPTSAPGLRTFIINTYPSDDGFRRRPACGYGRHDLVGYYYDSPLYLGLREMVEQEGGIPSDAKFYVLHTGSDNVRVHGRNGTRMRNTLVREDLNDRTSMTTRFLQLREFNERNDRRYVMRAVDEEVFTPILSEIQELGEGMLWRDCTGGERLPAAVLEERDKQFHPYLQGNREFRRPRTEEEIAYFQPEAEIRAGRMVVRQDQLNTVGSGAVRLQNMEHWLKEAGDADT